MNNIEIEMIAPREPAAPPINSSSRPGRWRTLLLSGLRQAVSTVGGMVGGVISAVSSAALSYATSHAAYYSGLGGLCSPSGCLVRGIATSWATPYCSNDCVMACQVIGVATSSLFLLSLSNYMICRITTTRNRDVLSTTTSLVREASTDTSSPLSSLLREGLVGALCSIVPVGMLSIGLSGGLQSYMDFIPGGLEVVALLGIGVGAVCGAALTRMGN